MNERELAQLLERHKQETLNAVTSERATMQSQIADLAHEVADMKDILESERKAWHVLALQVVKDD